MTDLLFMNNLFPLLMNILIIGATILYGVGGDYPRAVYWSAAAVLTTSTLFK